MISLDTKISDLSSVGQATAKKLSRLNIRQALDLIYHLPRRYEDFSQIKPIADLKVNEAATVCGQVEIINSRRARQKK